MDEQQRQSELIKSQTQKQEEANKLTNKLASETSKLNKGQNYILVEKTLSVSANVLYTYANLDFDL